jgi:hypothetical protein
VRACAHQQARAAVADVVVAAARGVRRHLGGGQHAPPHAQLAQPRFEVPRCTAGGGVARKQRYVAQERAHRLAGGERAGVI